MKKIIKIQQPPDAPMHLTWMINNICQNSCVYCPSNLHDGKNHYYEWENAKRFFEILFERYPSIHCSVSGGEPSLSPFFLDICKTFHAAGHTIGVTSNGAKSVNYWREIAQYLNYVCFSWHPEFPDENFEAKVLAASESTPVTVRIMMLSSHWDQCVEAYNKFSKLLEITAEPVKVMEYDNIDKQACYYTPDQTEWFNHNHGNHTEHYNYMVVERKKYFDAKARGEHINPTIRIKPYTEPIKILADYHFNDGTVVQRANASDYVNQGMTNFNGYTCEIGIKSLFVRPNGIIYLGNCLVGGKIGNINKPEKIEWPAQPTKCNIDLCHCSSDVNINKWINE